MEYAKKLSTLFTPNLLRGLPADEVDVVDSLTKAGAVVEQFYGVIERNLRKTESNVAKSWQYLKLYSVICKFLAQVLIGKYNHDEQVAKENWNIIGEFVTQNELTLFLILDVYEYVESLKVYICDGQKSVNRNSGE